MISIALWAFIAGCGQQKETKNELNSLSFNASKDVMIDSLKVATVLLDKMDYGNGATCFIVDGQLHCTRKELGFSIVKMPDDDSASFPIIELFGQANSKRFLKLLQFLNRNGIHSIGKRYDGVYNFEYKQHDYNPYNDFKRHRVIILL